MDSLRGLWVSAPPGQLSPLEQCKAWALREAARESGEPLNMEFVASRLSLKGGGNPAREAVRQLYLRMDAKGWLPGRKEYKRKPGPAEALSSAKKRRVAEAAMTLKKQNKELRS